MTLVPAHAATREMKPTNTYGNEKSAPAINSIVSSFHQKYHIPDKMQSHTLVALRGIATMDLTKKITTFIRTEQDDPISVTEIRDKVKQAYLSLVTKGRKEV